MNRRQLLKLAAAAPAASGLGSWTIASARGASSTARVRPSDPRWPSDAHWSRLNRDVAGRLIRVQSPLDACAQAPSSEACTRLFKSLKNPYFLGDEVALTQTLGWSDAWLSKPSVYAVAAQTTGDVVAAVNFAREHDLRLVVKGGGHSYQGTSNSSDSLLIWTRRMNAITLHDAFVAKGCSHDPHAAVTIEAGAIWGQAYNAVTTKAGRYVQGGGCMTVGVAGLIQSGGFGSFSKAFGMAAAGLLEAEVVTADGQALTANACTNPDLFWGLKGGGGGSLGVVTRLTLRTHDLPQTLGAVLTTVKANSEQAFRRLIGRTIAFYREALFNPNWGEQVAFRPGNIFSVAMVFQGLSRQQAASIWRPLFDWIAAAPQDFSFVAAPQVLAVPARQFWDPQALKQLPGIVIADDREGASEANVFWASNQGEAGQMLHSYQSQWLPAALLADDRQAAFADALFAGAKHWGISLHFNKGLAGAPRAAIEAARDTATNPAALDAFALAISGAQGPPAYPGIAGREPDLATARRQAEAVGQAMGELRKLTPLAASYVSESNFFEKDWGQSFWGTNYPRLVAVKNKYDPDGLFFVHHGVGSERWSADGFTRLT
jgi:FAD/FMN-containing dehydrogenase